MNEQSDAGYRYGVPGIIEDRIQISDIYLQDSSTSVASYSIDLSFPELRLYRTLRSREVSLLPGKVEAVLELWEKKYLRHLQHETDRYRRAAVDQLNRDAEGRLQVLNSILETAASITPVADWFIILRRGVFSVTPQDLYGIPDIPPYILTDADGRPADIKRLNQANRPDLEKTQSRFGTLTKLFQPDRVKDAVDQEMQDWSKRRSDIGVANAERRATLKQAQDIYDASKSMFAGERESSAQVLETVKANYDEALSEDFLDFPDACAIEEYCDLLMMAIEYPDEICSNWLLSYAPDRRALHIRLDLPSLDQLDLPKHYEYSSKIAEVVEHRLSEAEIADLCDVVSYQMVLRTMSDLFMVDEADAIDSITCDGEVAVMNPGSDEAASYVVMSVSAGKSDVMKLDIGTESPRALFEQLGGVTAGAPHLVMPVEPVGA